MKKGFIFGKFYPFHNGHKAMIDFALTHGDNIKVLVCSEKLELLSGETRANWIRQTYKDDPRVVVEVFDYKDSDYPSTSQADPEISRKWSEVFLRLFGNYDFFVTSEEYGQYIEEFTGIKHILFDPLRSTVPISASTLRSNIYENWQYLPDSVRDYFKLRVVIHGTESTGKTELTRILGKAFECNIVEEAGRDLVEGSKEFKYTDLDKILREHNERIQSVGLENFLTIIDTDYHETVSYGYFKYDQIIPVPSFILEESWADLHIYLSKDAPFVQDGTRFDLEDRNKLDLSHRKILRNLGTECYHIHTNDYEMTEILTRMRIDSLIRDKSRCLE